MEDYPKLKERCGPLDDSGYGPTDQLMGRYVMEGEEQWIEWAKLMPYINFPSDWFVQMIPPFGGAIVRFKATHESDPSISVSVYLDVYDRLGHMGKPYWEIYPYAEDVCRVPMEDTGRLVDRIQQVFDGEDNYDDEEEGGI